jgi:hypothetical protein
MAHDATPPLPGTDSGTPPPKTSPAPVAGGTVGAPAANVDSGNNARPRVELFGGLRGGRKRKDGKIPGSPEALEADRAKDAERKRLARERDRLANPEIIPAAIPASAPQSNPPAQNNSPAKADSLGVVAGVENFETVAWLAKDVEPLVNELVELTEELCQTAINTRCKKAKLPIEIAREIEHDARWATRAKAMIKQGGADLFAQLMNKSQIPLAIRPYIMITIGSLQIAIGQMKILKRLDLLILAANQKPTKPEPIKTP